MYLEEIHFTEPRLNDKDKLQLHMHLAGYRYAQGKEAFECVAENEKTVLGLLQEAFKQGFDIGVVTGREGKS